MVVRHTTVRHLAGLVFEVTVADEGTEVFHTQPLSGLCTCGTPSPGVTTCIHLEDTRAFLADHHCPSCFAYTPFGHLCARCFEDRDASDTALAA